MEVIAMRFDSKKVFKFAGEVSGCVVMGIVSAATQTLWYRIAEPKILNAMDKNEAKRKQPIGFRGGSPNGLLSPFRRFCNLFCGEVNVCETVCSEKGVALEGLADGYRGTEQLNG